MTQRAFEERRKLLQLEALYDVGRALNTLRPEPELLEELMHRAMAVLDARIGFIFSVDDNMEPHHVYLSSGDDEATPERIFNEHPVRQLMLSRAAFVGTLPSFLGGPGGAFVAAPMITGEKLVGVVGLVGKESRRGEEGIFEDDDLRFLESLAAIGAAAIDNTRNFHRVEMIRESLEDENRSLKQRMLREFSDRLMVGESAAMQRVIDLIARLSTSSANVLIRGESGTGKEMVARLLHGNSARKEKPFVAINCAALPETLLESELFGIERGVATGVEARPGKFELAQGGTVFLDEIGDIPLTLQAKLLRVLQEREVEKLGGRRRIPVNVRILAATHRNLEQMVERGEFRQDLYYRLRVVQIELPPLRDRKEDIPKLVRYFLDKYGKREGLEGVKVSQGAMRKLMGYGFPGNVRELENLIEGALAVTSDPVIDEEEILLPAAMGGEGGLPATEDLPDLRELERRYIAKVLVLTGGNFSKAAKILGIDRKTLYRLRDKWQNDPVVPKWDVH
jgi:transcriptional regulator with GAF, ATPase, and Fis domain